MEDINSSEYIRERIHPTPGDPFYLHLSDLLIALKTLTRFDYAKVLDYGCGGSPYRPLFGSCVYHRADLEGRSDLDFAYGPSARLPLEKEGYDCVLSTQVIEHVETPEVYLQEALRVLRPGAHLILTTHGLYQDHGSPYDYWRWTVFGLRRLVENVGFRVEQIKKLTTGPRGAVFLAEREFNQMHFNRVGAYGRFLSFGMSALRRLGARRRHEACDISFARNRVVEIGEPFQDLYIAIAILASRCD